MVLFSSAYSDKQRVQFFSDAVSMTKQCFRDECDINNILKKYKKTGLIEHVNRYSGSYDDFVGQEDYRTGIEKIREAEAMFGALPSNVRARFHNDPGEFLGFVANPANVAEMVELGLTKKPVSSGQAEPGKKDEVSQ